MDNAGFKIYLLFMTSWFLHLTERIPVLGLVRFDMLLVGLLFIVGFIRSRSAASVEPEAPEKPGRARDIDRSLKLVFLFILVATPFAEWPGSVLKMGVPELTKAVVFYYFTVWFVTTEKRLKIFIAVLLFTQVFRVFEPLFLHVTQGYWGSRAHMSGADFMNRLAGAPYDSVNPNGLAFIIISTIPFLHYFSAGSFKRRILYLATLGPFLYALILTGSRSGLIGLAIVVLGIVLKSKRRGLTLAMIFLGTIVLIPMLNEQQRDRYGSLVDSDSKNAATVQGRMEGVWNDFEVALRRPLFGHGLGTSEEANAHYSVDGIAMRSHNIYTEVAQELGFVGLLFFIYFLKVLITAVHGFIAEAGKTEISSRFTKALIDCLQVFLPMNIMFSFASYGLSKHDWYLMAGLLVVASRILDHQKLVSREFPSEDDKVSAMAQ